MSEQRYTAAAIQFEPRLGAKRRISRGCARWWSRRPARARV